jgi:hypothetical protein
MDTEPSSQLELSLPALPETNKGRQRDKDPNALTNKGFLICPERVRIYALDLAKRERCHSFTAVSVSFIQRIDARLRNIIRDEIHQHPSRGKRIS